MTKRSRSLLLLSVMLLQALLLLVPVNITERANFWSHVVHHSESQQHHHHQDNTLHLDEADAQSTDHVHIDSSSSASGLEPSDWASVWRNASSCRLSTALFAIPCPHLESPLRPPQHLV